MNLLVRKLSHNFSYIIKSPLNINLFKSQQGLLQIQRSLKARFRPQNLANQIAMSLQQFRSSLYDLQVINRSTNQLNNKIKAQFKKGQNKNQENIEKLKLQMVSTKQEQKVLQAKLIQLKLNIQAQIMKVGNLVHPEVPVSKDQKFNKILKHYPNYSNSNQTMSEHSTNKVFASYQELNQAFNISDLKRGQKVSGHRGYFLTTNGVKLAMALSMYGMNFLQEKGYRLYQTPALIFQSHLRQNCQLQTIQNDMYKIEGQKTYLIATSQQSMVSYYKNQVIQNRQKFPIKMAGYSSCFRKEAGAHGKDIHGLFRVHQFQKVEQFVICEGQIQKSQQIMNKMLQISQQFYQSLQIPYRVVDIVSGELNDSAIRKFDLQGWYPSQQKYRQLVSISNCTDYQSRLVNVQYRRQNGNQTSYVHMLNGTLTAVQRTITCILQNYYDSSSKKLKIPKKLQKFVGKQYFQKEIQ